MNKGLSSDQFILPINISNIANLYINLALNNANTHINIPIYSSSYKNGLSLSLMYNYLDKDVSYKLGKGFVTNYTIYVIRISDEQINLVKPDGEEIIFIKDALLTNIYVDSLYGLRMKIENTIEVYKQGITYGFTGDISVNLHKVYLSYITNNKFTTNLTYTNNYLTKIENTNINKESINFIYNASSTEINILKGTKLLNKVLIDYTTGTYNRSINLVSYKKGLTNSPNIKLSIQYSKSGYIETYTISNLLLSHAYIFSINNSLFSYIINELDQNLSISYYNYFTLVTDYLDKIHYFLFDDHYQKRII